MTRNKVYKVHKLQSWRYYRIWPFSKPHSCNPAAMAARERASLTKNRASFVAFTTTSTANAQYLRGPPLVLLLYGACRKRCNHARRSRNDDSKIPTTSRAVLPCSGCTFIHVLCPLTVEEGIKSILHNISARKFNTNKLEKKERRKKKTRKLHCMTAGYPRVLF